MTTKNKNGEPQTLADVDQEVKLAETVFDGLNLLAEKYPGLKCTGDEWHLPQNGVYKLLDTDLVAKDALALLHPEKCSNSMAQEVVKTLQTHCQVDKESLKSYAQFEDESKQAVLLCAQNGVVRVTKEKVELLPHSLDYNFGRQLAAAYNPQAKLGLYNQTLMAHLPDRLDRDLYFAFGGGYTLYPSCDLQTFLYIYGEDGTSKSALMNAFVSVLGKENVTGVKFSELCGDGKGYTIPSLYRAGLNLGAEAAQGELQESDLLKLLVEGSPVPVRGIYGRPFTMRDYHCKICVIGNQLPRFKGGTGAELRRMRFLHFKVQHQKVDTELEAKIDSERDGIFSRYMVPWLQYVLKTRRIPDGGVASTRVMETFRITHDPYKAFLKSRCHEVLIVPGAGDIKYNVDACCESKKLIFLAWRCYCEDHHLSDGLTENDKWFWRRVEDRWPQYEHYRPGGDGPRYIVGIKLNDGVPTEPKNLTRQDIEEAMKE